MDLFNVAPGPKPDELRLVSIQLKPPRPEPIDLLFTYKILFGLVDINWSNMFVRNERSITRGHYYKLYAKTSRTDVQHNFFCNRVVNIWNRLPAREDDFKSLRCFKSFLARVNLVELS